MKTLENISLRVVARYYWLRKWMGYPVLYVPSWLLLWFGRRLQEAQDLRSEGVWSSPPDFGKWWLGWALSIIVFLPGFLVAGWFRAADWCYKKSDFWGVDPS